MLSSLFVSNLARSSSKNTAADSARLVESCIAGRFASTDEDSLEVGVGQGQYLDSLLESNPEGE